MARSVFLLVWLAAQTLAQPPANQLPPEEDDKAKKDKEYVMNPLHGQKEIKTGDFYMKRGRYKAAAMRFEEATRWDPNSAEAFLKLGEAQEKLGSAQAAKTAFKQYLALAPDAKNAALIRKKLK